MGVVQGKRPFQCAKISELVENLRSFWLLLVNSRSWKTYCMDFVTTITRLQGVKQCLRFMLRKIFNFFVMSNI